KLLDPVFPGSAPVDVAFSTRGIRYPHCVVRGPRSIDPAEARAPNIQSEILMPETEPAELGFEVLLLAELFHHPPVTFTPDSHCAPKELQCDPLLLLLHCTNVTF